MDSDQELKSLKRGLRVLALLNDHEQMTLSDIARRLQLPRTTAERVVMTLLSEGYVERDKVGKVFRLAPKVCGLSRGFTDESWLTHLATPLLFQTTERIGWPLAIATPLGEKMIVRVTTDPATSLHLYRRHIGSEIAMMQASSGIVFLAFAPPQQREHMLTVLRHSTDPAQSPVHNNRVLANVLATTRKHGCAFSPDDSREGSLSVPIFRAGDITAVLLMMYIRSAVNKKSLLDDYLPQLKQLANEISRRMTDGGVAPTAPRPASADRPASVRPTRD